MARVLLLDPSFAGISGNMILGCLLDLGASMKRLEDLAKMVSRRTGEDIRLESKRVKRYGFGALWVDWVVPWTQEDVSGMTFLKELREIAEETELSPQVRDAALKAGEILVDAEAAVHDSSREEVRFHELGSLDTILDILGVAALLDGMGFPEDLRVYSAPVVVGRGPIEVSHGHLPVPPFVTTEILRRYSIPFHHSHVGGELATPTGVALLAALVEGYDPLFTIRAEAVGYGAGGREVRGVPNVLKAVLGTTGPSGEDVVSVLETNLDDVTGEVLGHLAEVLQAARVLDFHIIPTLTKKNRPGYILQVLVPAGAEEEMAELVMRETGSLGVRVNRIERRLVLARETLKVRVRGLEGKEVRYKLARDRGGNILSVKPEYEDVKRVAMDLGIPLREALRRAQAEAPGREV